MPVSDARELLTENLALIERTAAFAARRYRLNPQDAEEFAANVRLRLVENDYAILRAYEARSSFATFISIVVQRMAIDDRIHVWGRWHASAEAKRFGAAAVEIERLLFRDGRSLEDALTVVAANHRELDRESLNALAARLPPRMPRHHEVDLEEAERVAVSPPSGVEERIVSAERREAAQCLSAKMSEIIAALPDEERLILQLRFEGGMAVAQIARALQIDQRLLYRRIENRMREIRAQLERDGVASRDVLDLLGHDDAIFDFDLGNRNRRPSTVTDETVAHPEGS